MNTYNYGRVYDDMYVINNYMVLYKLYYEVFERIPNVRINICQKCDRNSVAKQLLIPLYSNL